MSIDPTISLAIEGLPLLASEDLDVQSLDDHCPICLISFRSIFEKEEGGDGDVEGGEGEGKGGEERKGVTKVEGCGHVFCLEE